MILRASETFELQLNEKLHQGVWDDWILSLVAMDVCGIWYQGDIDTPFLERKNIISWQHFERTRNLACSI